MQVSDSSLLQVPRTLEVELHGPAVRNDSSRLDALLHEDFLEFGCSGETHTKADILLRLPAEPQDGAVIADRFQLRRLDDDVGLLTYRCANLLANGTYDRFTLRSSLWERATRGWQMSFHQGTLTAPFEPAP